jgi:hypothetical protein
MVTGELLRAKRGDEVSLLPVQHIAHSRHSAFTCPPRGMEAKRSNQEPHVSHKKKRRDRIPVVVISAAAHGQNGRQQARLGLGYGHINLIWRGHCVDAESAARRYAALWNPSFSHSCHRSKSRNKGKESVTCSLRIS